MKIPNKGTSNAALEWQAGSFGLRSLNVSATCPLEGLVRSSVGRQHHWTINDSLLSALRIYRFFRRIIILLTSLTLWSISSS